MRLVLFGPPGAGKGTQASLLETRRGLRHVSTGALLREEIERGSDAGRAARGFVTRGKLVPDELAWRIARTALEETRADEFVLDGYPRTAAQIRYLRNFLETRERALDVVLCIELDTETVLRRITRRRVDRATGETYHLDWNPPPDGLPRERLEQREDDRPASVRRRLRIFEETTSPILEHYEKRDLVRRVDGTGTIEEVYDRIDAILRALSAGDGTN